MTSTATGLAVQWRDAGCKTMARVKPDGRAAWRLRAPRRSPDDWAIEAAHCPYLGRHPYNLGPDAWRISILFLRTGWGRHDRSLFEEVARLTVRSEREALDAVLWLDAVASAGP